MGVFIHVESAVCTSSSSPFPTSTSFTLFWRPWMNERCPEANELFRLSVYLCFSSSLVVPIGLPFARSYRQLSSIALAHMVDATQLMGLGWGGEMAVFCGKMPKLFTFYRCLGKTMFVSARLQAQFPGRRDDFSCVHVRFACISFYTCTVIYQFARTLICSILHIHICGIIYLLICQYTDTIMDRYVLFQCLQYSYVFLSLSIYIQIFLDYANLCTCILMYYSLKIRMSIQPIMICNMHIVSCPRTPLSLNTSV